MANWIRACMRDDIEAEDLIRFDHDGRTFAIYRSPDDEFFCTDGLCTHEAVHLADGLVMDYVIECPKHNGQFDYRTGEAVRSPVCEALLVNPRKCLCGLLRFKGAQRLLRARPFKNGFTIKPSQINKFQETTVLTRV